jgi:hypothetical protein
VSPCDGRQGEGDRQRQPQDDDVVGPEQLESAMAYPTSIASALRFFASGTAIR